MKWWLSIAVAMLHCPPREARISHAPSGRLTPAAVGNSSHEFKLRIIGGQAAGASDFPWALYIDKIGGRSIVCSGSVISKRWIVTAAHCVLNDANTGYVSPSPIGSTQVVIGCADLSSKSCVRYNVRSIIVHPCYTPSYDQDHDDIAMMELDSDVQLNSSKFAVVDGIAGLATYTDGSSVTLAGFGMTNPIKEVASSKLMRVDVSVASQDYCQRQNPYSYVKKFIDFNNVVCSDGKAGKDSCSGDSGGPIIFTSNGVSWLIGVLSKGSELPATSSLCAVAGRLGVYTKIRNYANFVYATMKGCPFTCNKCPCTISPPAQGLMNAQPLVVCAAGRLRAWGGRALAGLDEGARRLLAAGREPVLLSTWLTVGVVLLASGWVNSS